MLAQHRFLFIISAFILAELHINAAQCVGDVSNPKIINLLDGENGSIYSPNYPFDYGTNENCNWLFNATRRVLIYFTFMDFEACCSCDYVEIFDGSSDSYKSPIMTGCDTSFPRPVYSSGRYLFMKFKSDSSIQGRGFVAHYKALSWSSAPTLYPDTTPPTPMPAFKCKPQSDSSTYTYVGTDRSLSISGQKNGYFSRCFWAIYTDEENIIELTFDRMSMQSTYYCNTAYVQVIDGGSYTDTIIGTYCSDQGKTVFSTRNRLLIIFYSGGYYGMDSFEATVRARKAVAVKAVEIVVPIVVAVILFAVILTVIMLTRSAVRQAGLAQSANNVPMQSLPNCTQEPPPPDSSQLVSPVNTVSANLSI